MKAIKCLILLSCLYFISCSAIAFPTDEDTPSCRLIDQIHLGMTLEDAQKILGQLYPLKKVEPSENYVVWARSNKPEIVPPITLYVAELPGARAPWNVYLLELYFDASGNTIKDKIYGPTCP